MGLYDYLKCEYPLPVELKKDVWCQSKDTPAQWMDTYEIRSDGTIWHQDYDLIDRGDPKEEGLKRLRGCLHPENKRWVQLKITGEITFGGETQDGRWVTFSTYFVKGELKEIHLLDGSENESAAALLEGKDELD